MKYQLKKSSLNSFSFVFVAQTLQVYHLIFFQEDMQGNYVRTLLYDLSSKLGRKPQDMDRFVAIFEQNWYQTKEALAQLKPTDYARLQIPQRLAVMIIEAVQPPKQQRQQHQHHQYQKMDVESPIQNDLHELKTKLQDSDFRTAVELLSRIFTNIRENLIDQKYRTLKKSNAKVNALLNFKEIIRILRFGGFEDAGNAFIMNKINISTIDDCIESINKFLPEATFNPYQSHISSIGKTTMQNYEGASSVMYNQMLAQLQRQRNKIMSQPIMDRKIKIYQIQPSNLKEFDRMFQQSNESQQEQKYLQLENVKQILKKQAQQPKFMNRRMQEYLDLVKKPVFAQTLIRVKLYDNWVFECRFSPLQTLQTLCDVFRDCIENKNIDYYLYMTPPVQKLSGVILRKTFYDLGCVPRAIFYFKCEQQLKGNIFKIKKTNIFGF